MSYRYGMGLSINQIWVGPMLGNEREMAVLKYINRNYLSVFAVLFIAVLTGCQDEGSKEEYVQPVRGIKTVTVELGNNFVSRRYPSVLQADEQSLLSFEIGGKLKENRLSVGQMVTKGQVLLELDKTALRLAVEQATAAFKQAKAQAEQASNDYQRYQALYKKQITSKATLDKAKANKAVSDAQQEQAAKGLQTAKERLTKSTLRAPFDGIIDTLKNNSFVTVAAGETIASMYAPDSFEARFSVPYEVVSRLNVGKKVTVRLADDPSVVIKGTVVELASSAVIVSSFPVVVRLEAVESILRMGMAVEVAMDFSVTQGSNFQLPISAILVEESELDESREAIPAKVFVYDESTKTVKKRDVMLNGLVANNAIISKGLNAGERVVVAGVTFLREGMPVNLLADSQ